MKRAKFVVQPFKHSQALTEVWHIKTAREAFDAMRSVVSCNPKKLSFESAYRRIYQLCLQRHGATVTTMIKLLSRLCAHRPASERELRCTMIKDICLYYEKAFVPARKLPTCQEVFEASRAELEAWAIRTLDRRKFKELWTAYYFQPGGPYERRVASESRWGGKREREEEDVSNKRAKRDNVEEQPLRDESDE